MALICEACRCQNASATCTGFASNPGCHSCARCKLSRTAHCYSITATSLALRVSCPSAWRRATRAGRAAIGSNRSPGWKRINAERYRLFEGPPRKPELTEAQKTLSKEAPGARQDNRAPAITVAKPRHRPRAEKAAIHLGARDCRARAGLIQPVLRLASRENCASASARRLAMLKRAGWSSG